MTQKPSFGRLPLGLGIFASLAVVSPSANAALLLYEGFNGYTSGAGADTITPNGNTVGLATSGTGSSYANGSSPAANPASTLTISSAGLSLGSLIVSGGGLNFTGTTAVASANITTTTASTTVWGSFVVSMTALSSATASSGFEVRLNTNAGSLSGNAYFRSNADTRGEISPGVGVSYGGTVGPAGGTLATSVPYLIISKFDTSATGGSTLWALDAAQFDAFVAAGRTEAYLNANATITASAPKPATGTFGWNSATTPAYLEIVSSGASGKVDEIRYGESILDVTPVPEPSAALLIAAGSALGLVRRKRSC